MITFFSLMLNTFFTHQFYCMHKNVLISTHHNKLLKRHSNFNSMVTKWLAVIGTWPTPSDSPLLTALVMRSQTMNVTYCNTNKQLKVYAQSNQSTINFSITIIPGFIPGNRKHPLVAVMNCFPVLPNHATTGHKELQGQTKENLLFNAWFYGKNWPYIVLACVKQLLGLFLWTPINSFLLIRS